MLSLSPPHHDGPYARVLQLGDDVGGVGTERVGHHSQANLRAVPNTRGVCSMLQAG
jgi:hypothetical protein